MRRLAPPPGPCRSFALCVVWVATGSSCARRCGDNEPVATAPSPSTPGNAPSESPQPAAVRGLPPPSSATAVADPRCLRFCERANECAARENRPTRDCARDCLPGGVHAAAPEALWACADQPCGPAFARCTLDEVLRSMRASDVPVFPPLCEGLCHRLAWCAERLGRPTPPWATDCERSCREPPWSTLPEPALACAGVDCGQPLRRCIERTAPDLARTVSIPD
ncbi:MAG: hypothetical protein NZ898_13495 [Myxococcota bacterium]|nr:hypothetical protein [Myxococcota bacterium]MDW8361964.1 hypothetical protein [Myxococcales bacterium]